MPSTRWTRMFHLGFHLQAIAGLRWQEIWWVTACTLLSVNDIYFILAIVFDTHTLRSISTESALCLQTPNSNLSISYGESHMTADTEATSSCTALNPAWPDLRATPNARSLSNIVELGKEKKGPTSPRLWMTSHFPHLLLLNLQPPEMLDLSVNSVVELGNEKKGLASNRLRITTHNPLLLLHKPNIQMPDPLLSNVIQLGKPWSFNLMPIQHFSYIF